MKAHLILIIVAIQSTLINCGEIFTAMCEIQKIIQNIHNKEIVKGFEEYIINREDHLKLAEERISFLESFSSDSDSFLNPIDTYHIIRFFTNFEINQDLADLRLNEMIEELKNKEALPINEDLEGACQAIVRLQKAYNLDIEEMIAGRIKGHFAFDKLNWDDCLTIGINSLNKYFSVSWLNESLKLFENLPAEDKEKEIKNSRNDKITILENLAHFNQYIGNYKTSLKLTQEILELSPENEFAEENLKFIQENGEYEDNLIISPIENDIYRTYYEKNSLLCRGEQEQRLGNELKCQFIKTYDSYFLIGPAKEEILSVDPKITLLHDVVFESEIDYMIKASLKKLYRDTVTGYTKEDMRKVMEMRVSKSVGLLRDDPISIKIDERIALFTNLETKYGESIGILNYGIGGQYEPHVDFFRNMDGYNHLHEVKDQRIATVLVYLSDVDEGGATIFPELNLTVWPKKGSAVFWWNFLENLENDYRTLHAGCPVLIGSKWVINKWIPISAQVFKRPCREL